MPTIVTLKLRQSAYNPNDRGRFVLAVHEDIDLDQLTPRARALAAAIAQMPGGDKAAGEILCQHVTLRRRDVIPNPEVWLSSEEMEQPARQSWSAWGRYLAYSEMPPVEYLERQARKIPPEWRIVSAFSWGSGPHPPVPSAAAGAADDRLTVRGVVDRLASLHGRHIGPGTWRSYASRDQAPRPVDRVGREGLWSLADVDAWARGEWRAEGR